MEESSNVDPAVGDVTETIAFGLLSDAEKLGQVCTLMFVSPLILQVWAHRTYFVTTDQ
jgi:hypothetical protein